MLVYHAMPCRLRAEVTRACKKRGIKKNVFKISDTIGTEDDGKGNRKQPRRGKLLSVLSNVLPEALEELKQSDMVAAVFPDTPLITQQDDGSEWDGILNPSSKWSCP